MAHWLIKSEPNKYSWDQLTADGETLWDGVRNAMATINLKAMKTGDDLLFYHSNIGLEIVGIAKVVGEAEPDPGDEAGKAVAVRVAPVRPLKTPVTLKAVKAEPKLADMQLVRQSRLSVAAVTEAEWKQILAMSEA